MARARDRTGRNGVELLLNVSLRRLLVAYKLLVAGLCCAIDTIARRLFEVQKCFFTHTYNYVFRFYKN